MPAVRRLTGCRYLPPTEGHHETFHCGFHVAGAWGEVMTLDGGWALIIAGVLVLVMGGAGALIWRHVDNAQDEGEEANKAVAAVSLALHAEQVERLKFERHVAETYARTSGVERMETNIFAVMNRFETKLDKVLESSMTHGVAK